MYTYFYSCATRQLATNELPLSEDEIEDIASTSNFTHPFSISEDEEIGNDSEGDSVTPIASTVFGGEIDSSDSSDFKKPFTGHIESPKRYFDLRFS